MNSPAWSAHLASPLATISLSGRSSSPIKQEEKLFFHNFDFHHEIIVKVAGPGYSSFLLSFLPPFRLASAPELSVEMNQP